VPAPGAADVEAGAVPGGAIAVGVHAGPYNQLGDTYAAMERWMEANGYRPSGSPWESYVTDTRRRSRHKGLADGSLLADRDDVVRMTRASRSSPGGRAEVGGPDFHQLEPHARLAPKRGAPAQRRIANGTNNLRSNAVMTFATAVLQNAAPDPPPEQWARGPVRWNERVGERSSRRAPGRGSAGSDRVHERGRLEHRGDRLDNRRARCHRVDAGGPRPRHSQGIRRVIPQSSL
jgi:hypothetical protein